VVQFGKEASQTRDSWVAKNATLRAARPDSLGKLGTGSSLRKERWLRMRSKLHHYRRYVRRTNAHSRKLANHKAVFSLWVAWYNFCRVNTAIRMTPCMAAGIASTIWTMRDLLAAE
jgi:hypothetical protein